MEQQKPVPGYYFSESEWNRLGCGPLPAERNRELQQALERSVEDKGEAGKDYN